MGFSNSQDPVASSPSSYDRALWIDPSRQARLGHLQRYDRRAHEPVGRGHWKLGVRGRLGRQRRHRPVRERHQGGLRDWRDVLAELQRMVERRLRVPHALARHTGELLLRGLPGPAGGRPLPAHGRPGDGPQRRQHAFHLYGRRERPQPGQLLAPQRLRCRTLRRIGPGSWRFGDPRRRLRQRQHRHSRGRRELGRDRAHGTGHFFGRQLQRLDRLRGDGQLVCQPTGLFTGGLVQDDQRVRRDGHGLQQRPGQRRRDQLRPHSLAGQQRQTGLRDIQRDRGRGHLHVLLQQRRMAHGRGRAERRRASSSGWMEPWS